jgi:tetratricopeptide (TPR) repeat protein
MTPTPKKSKSLSNETIENYIQRVTELSQSASKILPNEELEKIAADLGISSEEIKMAQQRSQAPFIRAKGYFNLKHWDDAIAELQEAIGLNPSNLEMLNLLANAHLGRWYEQHHRDDEEQIRTRIKQCLEIQPDHKESLLLLAKLAQAIRKYQYQTVFWRGFISIFLGSIVGFFFLNDIYFNLFEPPNSEL